jgi:hypothetical protein
MTKEAIIELIKEVAPESVPYLKVVAGSILAVIPSSDLVPVVFADEWISLLTNAITSAIGVHVAYYAAMGIKNRSNKTKEEVESVRLDNEIKQKELGKD